MIAVHDSLHPQKDACLSDTEWSQRLCDLLRHHHFHKFLVVDLAIAVDVRFSDHFIHLLVRQLLTQIGHNMAKLSRANESIAISIEYLERLDQLLLGVSVLHLSGHQTKELWEVNGSITIGVDLVDHILEFGLGGILTQGAHNSPQLFGGDSSIAVLVEEGEGLLEFGNLLLSQLVRHCSGVLFCVDTGSVRESLLE